MINSGVERLARIVIGGIFLIVPSYISLLPALSWIFVILGLALVITGLIGYSPVYHYQNSKKKS